MKAITFIAFALVVNAHAQDFPRKDLNLEMLVDEIFPIQDQDLNYEELYENLAQLLSNPVDLNTVTNEQMRALLVVTEEEINSFLSYRKENGPLLSVYELQSVPGWNRSTFDKIIPFVTVHDSKSKLNSSIFKRISEEKNNYLVARYERVLETKKGYKFQTDSSQHYAGSPDKLYLRYRVSSSNDFSVGFTAEKDPGELLQWAPAQRQYGFDYLSFHAQVQNKGKLKNLVVGDYQSQFGQGLILGSAFGFGKNSETVTTIRRSNLGFLPYTAAGENLFFRGVGVSYSLTNNIVLHALYSYNFKDGSISQTDEDATISSFTASGLHRTALEIQRRQLITETGKGAVIQFRNQRLDGGLIFHQVDFSQPVLRRSFPYNQFAFNGSTNQNIGAYLNFTWANFTFFSEAAQTIGHGRAVVAGLLGNLSRQLEVSILYRNFTKDFYSFYSNAFAESTAPQNEIGMYWGWKFFFNKRFSASGYMDLYQFPWLRYRGYSPSEGSEWLLRFNYSPSKNVKLFLQVREESKIRNLSDDSKLYQYDNGIKRNYWINCDYAAPPHFTFKTRVQFSTYDIAGKTTRGLALIQDVNLSVRRWGFGLRHAIFDTDDYDNRLYVYERNVWLAYSFPPYYGIGVRNYVLVQYNLSKQIDLWLRWSHLRYTDRMEIGTGSETIAGNSANDVKFQVRVKF